MANPISGLDDLIRRLGKIDPAAPRAHAGVVFDPRAGLGDTADAANIDYRGFQAYMTPRSFLELNEPRDFSLLPNDYIKDAIAAGDPIGTPTLYVRKTPEGWRVHGHEGRGRMAAMQERSPNALLPVGVHPYGEVRARHLTPEDLFRIIEPDERGLVGTRAPLAIWQQKPYVRPGWEENDAVLQAIRELLP